VRGFLLAFAGALGATVVVSAAVYLGMVAERHRRAAARRAELLEAYRPPQPTIPDEEPW